MIYSVGDLLSTKVRINVFTTDDRYEKRDKDLMFMIVHIDQHGKSLLYDHTTGSYSIWNPGYLEGNFDKLT